MHSLDVRLGARRKRDAIEQIGLVDLAQLLGHQIDVIRTKERLDGTLVRANASLQCARARCVSASPRSAARRDRP